MGGRKIEELILGFTINGRMVKIKMDDNRKITPPSFLGILRRIE